MSCRHINRTNILNLTNLCASSQCHAYDRKYMDDILDRNTSHFDALKLLPYAENMRVTLIMLSAYFINHDTSSPLDPRFNTTNHVVRV